MNINIKYIFYIHIISYVYYSYCFFNSSFSIPRICLTEDDIPPYYYLDDITGETLLCDYNCYKCSMLKPDHISKCIACNDNYFLYKYRCVDVCPDDTYFYSYTKNIITSTTISENRVINVCDEECEKGYSAYIIQVKNDNNEDIINKICILNENEHLKNELNDKLNSFYILDNTGKLIKIQEQITKINDFNEIKTDGDFIGLNKEFILLNEYIYDNRSILIEQQNLLNDFNTMCNNYYVKIESYFNSTGGHNGLLSNTNDKFIYFISSLSSLYKNKDLLIQNNIGILNNYIYIFSQSLSNIPLSLSDIKKINIITNFYSTFINISLNEDMNYIDPNFNKGEFDSNEYYRYTHEMILNEKRLKLMNVTNNLIKFLNSFHTSLLLYKDDFIYFYKQELSEEKTDKQIIMSKLGLEIDILGSETNDKTDQFTISKILNLIDEGKIDNYKIIFPKLKSINNNVNWYDSFINIIIFNDKYPLLNMNNTNYVSPNFFEIILYDNNSNVINIKDLNKDNLIKIIKKKSPEENSLDTCVYYDPSKNNLYDKGLKSYNLIQYILCSSSHLSTFTLTSFSPSYLLSKAENNKKISEEETISNSWWIKDTNMLKKLTVENAIIIYINLGIIFLCIILFIIKFFIKTEPTKAELLIEDSYIRYTMNEDTESDKKILKYLIEKEIEFILKNRSDYEKQKQQEQALNKNDIFNTDKQIITIVEDGSDDDDEEDINLYRRNKKVSFVESPPEKGYRKSLLRNRALSTTKKRRSKKKEINIELSNVKNEINEKDEFDENEEEKENSSSKRNKYFDSKYSKRKTVTTSSITTSMRSNTLFNKENAMKEKQEQKNIKIKKETISERFQKCLKEQKNRLVYSIMDKTLSEFKGNGQNTLDIPTSMIKRPLSMIGITNALNRVSNKDDEKILIKHEFFVILKLILYILYQYEYRFISLFNQIILPITRNDLIVLVGFRLSLQLVLSIIYSPRYFGDKNYHFGYNILAMILTLITCDIIYTIIELILMKKKISTSTENKDKNLIKFKQIIKCIIGYIIIIFIFFFGLYHSILISLYLKEKNIICKYIINFVAVIAIDYLIYENIIIIIKGFILTYVVYQDVEGCGLKCLEVFNMIFIFYLAE